MTRQRLALLAALALVAATGRVLPHPPNFTPTAAVALFVAATFPGAGLALVASLGSLLLGDVAMELAHRAGRPGPPGFYPGQWAIYASHLPTIVLGLLIRDWRTPGMIAAATLAGAVAFFLGSNFASWYGQALNYQRTLAGLTQAYQMGLPFFRNSLAGDATFSAALFGGLALAEARFPAVRARPVPST